jgi:hypothetical protein
MLLDENNLLFENNTRKSLFIEFLLPSKRPLTSSSLDLSISHNTTDLINEYKQSKLIITRLGNIESRFLGKYLYDIKTSTLYNKPIDTYMKLNAGIYYTNELDHQKILNWWSFNTIEIIRRSTLSSCLLFFATDMMLWGSLGLRGKFYNYGGLYKIVLQNSEKKKVLFIGQAVESVIAGYNNLNNFWNQMPITNFTLYTVATPQTTFAPYPDISSKETTERIVQEIIEKYSDFDTAVLGCGSYGPPIMNLLYNKFGNTKNMLYIGSNIYPMFGITTKMIKFSNDSKEYNSSASIHALEKYNSSLHKHIDNGKYWSDH